MEETHDGTWGDRTASRVARTPPPGPTPIPGSRPQTPAPSASDLSGTLGCCCRRCCCRSRYYCCYCHRRRPWHSCAGPSRAPLEQARVGGLPRCVGGTGSAGARGPLAAVGAAARVLAATPTAAPVPRHLPPRLGGLSPACRLRAPGPRERRTCDSGGRRERAANRPARPCPFPAEPRLLPAHRRLSDAG